MYLFPESKSFLLFELQMKFDKMGLMEAIIIVVSGLIKMLNFTLTCEGTS